jgi:hypothetical protein
MNAKKDQNSKAIALGVSDTDGVTPLALTVDPSTGYLNINSVSTGSLTSNPRHRIDQNNIPTCYGVSSTDGVTLVPIATDASGYLLVQFV